jgi:hypothetical protein
MSRVASATPSVALSYRPEIFSAPGAFLLSTHFWEERYSWLRIEPKGRSRAFGSKLCRVISLAGIQVNLGSIPNQALENALSVVSAARTAAFEWARFSMRWRSAASRTER